MEFSKEKECKKCHISKAQDQFYKCKRLEDGLRQWCIACEKEHNQKYYLENKEKESVRLKTWRKAHSEIIKECDRKRNKTEKRKEWKKEWIKKNPEKVRANSKRAYEKSQAKGYHAEYTKIYYHGKGREKCLARLKKYYTKIRNTLKGRLDHNISSALNGAMKGGKRGRSWKDLLGYGTEDLFKRLDSTMPEGYSWDDYMNSNLHIDHIIPKSSFQYKTSKDSEFRKCWSLNNLQLLPALDNIRKSDKILE